MNAVHKIIGRSATPCRKCGSVRHWINKLGGVQCEQCSPAKKSEDVVLRIRIVKGRWADADSTQAADSESPADSWDSAVELNAKPLEALTDQGNVIPQSNSRLIREDQEQQKETKSDKAKEDKKSVRHVIFDNRRGPNGELSQQELDLFSSDELWNQPEWLVVLKPKVRTVDRLGRRKT